MFYVFRSLMSTLSLVIIMSHFWLQFVQADIYQPFVLTPADHYRNSDSTRDDKVFRNFYLQKLIKNSMEPKVSGNVVIKQQNAQRNRWSSTDKKKASELLEKFMQLLLREKSLQKQPTYSNQQ